MPEPEQEQKKREHQTKLSAAAFRSDFVGTTVYSDLMRHLQHQGSSPSLSYARVMPIIQVGCLASLSFCLRLADISLCINANRVLALESPEPCMKRLLSISPFLWFFAIRIHPTRASLEALPTYSSFYAKPNTCTKWMTKHIRQFLGNEFSLCSSACFKSALSGSTTTVGLASPGFGATGSMETLQMATSTFSSRSRSLSIR